LNLGVSQKDLAKLSGVTQSMIAKVESGKISPSYLKTKAIFDALEMLEQKKEIHARDIMHRKVVGVDAEDRIADVVKVMRETGYSQLPVFSGKAIVGSISEKIITDKLTSLPGIGDISHFRAAKVMAGAFPRVDEETAIHAVSGLLQYDLAVLVTKKGQVTGIITKADLLKMIRG